MWREREREKESEREKEKEKKRKREREKERKRERRLFTGCALCVNNCIFLFYLVARMRNHHIGLASKLFEDTSKKY